MKNFNQLLQTLFFLHYSAIYEEYTRDEVGPPPGQFLIDRPKKRKQDSFDKPLTPFLQRRRAERKRKLPTPDSDQPKINEYIKNIKKGNKENPPRDSDLLRRSEIDLQISDNEEDSKMDESIELIDFSEDEDDKNQLNYQIKDEAEQHEVKREHAARQQTVFISPRAYVPVELSAGTSPHDFTRRHTLGDPFPHVPAQASVAMSNQPAPRQSSMVVTHQLKNEGPHLSLNQGHPSRLTTTTSYEPLREAVNRDIGKIYAEIHEMKAMFMEKEGANKEVDPKVLELSNAVAHLKKVISDHEAAKQNPDVEALKHEVEIMKKAIQKKDDIETERQKELEDAEREIIALKTELKIKEQQQNKLEQQLECANQKAIELITSQVKAKQDKPSAGKTESTFSPLAVIEMSASKKISTADRSLSTLMGITDIIADDHRGQKTSKSFIEVSSTSNNFQEVDLSLVSPQNRSNTPLFSPMKSPPLRTQLFSPLRSQSTTITKDEAAVEILQEKATTSIEVETGDQGTDAGLLLPLESGLEAGQNYGQLSEHEVDSSQHTYSANAQTDTITSNTGNANTERREEPMQTEVTLSQDSELSQANSNTTAFPRNNYNEDNGGQHDETSAMELEVNIRNDGQDNGIIIAPVEASSSGGDNDYDEKSDCSDHLSTTHDDVLNDPDFSSVLIIFICH